MGSPTICAVTVAENKYGYEGAERIRVYSYNGCEDMSVGRLTAAICSKIGCALEQQAVAMMNISTQQTRKLNALSECIENLVSGTWADYSATITAEGYAGMTAKEFLTDVMGMKFSDDDVDGLLPATFKDESDRIRVYTGLQDSLESITTQSQERMIDLQTCLSRRDVAFSTASNTVSALGTALTYTAENF